MTVARKEAAQAQRGKTEVNPRDALVLLTAEHNHIDKLAREFERHRKTANTVEKGKAALRLCQAFERYETIKQEVFYPAAEAVLVGEDKEMLGKARVAHEALDQLIDKIENRPADDADFDSTVAVFSEQADRLMKAEEEKLFPRLRHSKLDLVGTGERMASRKTELETTPIDRESIRRARKVMGGRA